jgi:hypothetical protein
MPSGDATDKPRPRRGLPPRRGQVQGHLPVRCHQPVPPAPGAGTCHGLAGLPIPGRLARDISKRAAVGPGFDPKMGEALAGAMADCQGILLGRTTYEMFEPAWSPRTAEEDPGAPFMNDTMKYAVSSCWRRGRGATPRSSGRTTPVRGRIHRGSWPRTAGRRGQMRPARMPQAAAAAREERSSLCRMLARCRCTVCSLRTSR